MWRAKVLNVEPDDAQVPRDLLARITANECDDTGHIARTSTNRTNG
jgi:hypothetical protein